MCVLVAQSCPTLCDPMDCSSSCSSVHGIPQARILEGVGISFSRGSFQPRDQTQLSCIASGFFTIWGTRETKVCPVIWQNELEWSFNSFTNITFRAVFRLENYRLRFDLQLCKPTKYLITLSEMGSNWDFLGGPVIKTSASNARDWNSISGQGAKISRA